MERPECSANPDNAFLIRFEAIKAELRKNPNVFYAGELDVHKEFPNMLNFGEESHDNWDGVTQTYSIVISPSKPIFAVKKLNLFMEGLIKEKPARRNEFQSSPNGDLCLGGLTFEKQMGSDTQIIKINIYPNPDIARLMHKFEKTQEQGYVYVIDLHANEVIEKDGVDWIGVNAYNLRHCIDKKLLRVLKKHKNAFAENNCL